MTDKTSNMFDAQMAAALDRYDTPALSVDFADRVMAALDADMLIQDHTPTFPTLPNVRAARDRRFGWARRRMAVVTATLALGVASMSAAATGLLTDFGIRIPVVTDYVTKHLGIKPVHLWHHAAKPVLHKATIQAHVQVIHSNAPLPVAEIPMPTPAQVIPATGNAPAVQPLITNRRINTSRAIAVGSGALAISEHLHRGPSLPAHPLSLRTEPALHMRQLTRARMAEPGVLSGPKFDRVTALHPHPEAAIRHEPLVPAMKLAPAPIGSVGHPGIPDEIIQLHSPAERAIERETREHAGADPARSGAGRQASESREDASPKPRSTNTDRRADAERRQPSAESPAARQSTGSLGEPAEKLIQPHQNADHPVGQGARHAKPPRPFAPHAIRAVHTRR